MALSFLSMVYASTTDYANAIASAQQGLESAQESKNPLAEMMLLAQRGDLSSSLGDYPNAIAWYEQALTLNRKYQNPLMEGQTLVSLAGIYSTQGDSRKAIELTQQATAAFEASQSPLFKSISLFSRSTAYADLQDYPEAIAAAQEALVIVKEMKHGGMEFAILVRLGYLHGKSGQTEKAIAFYQAALETDPTPEIPGSGAGARTGLARVYRSLQMPTVAIAYYKQAVSGIVEHVRRTIKGLPPQLQRSFLQAGREGEKNADVYRELADLLLSQGRVLEAQQVVELLKAQESKNFQQERSGGKTPDIALNSTEEKILGLSRRTR